MDYWSCTYSHGLSVMYALPYGSHHLGLQSRRRAYVVGALLHVSTCALH